MRATDLSLYGTISMSLMIGLLAGMILLALLDRGGDDSAPAIAPLLAAARADQLRREAVLGTPTSEQPIVRATTRMQLPPRGQGITAEPGRHRRADAAATQRPSLVTAGLEEALAWLMVDRIKRDVERREFRELLVT